jgi:hypothetical protein
MILGSCSGNPQGPSSPYGLYNYLNVNPDVISFEGQQILISDKPQENTMLDANLWKSWWTDYLSKQWNEIAANYIERSGRNLEIIESHRILPGEVEFIYVCN